MVHTARHGGQLGMSDVLHIEVVSEVPGQYKLYLSDPEGEPIPLEGVAAKVALIDRSGNELEIFEAELAPDGDFLFAEGDLAEATQADIRVRVILPDQAEPVEMDFTLSYGD